MTRSNPALSRPSSALSRRSSLAALMVLGVGSLGGCGHPPAPASAPTALKDQDAPVFKRASLNGPAIDMSALRGQVVVVKFFAKYCVPCRKTLPEFQGLVSKRNDVQFIGIDEDDDESDARLMVSTYALTFPVIHDVGNVLSGRFRVTDMPSTVVIGPDGKVRWLGRFDRTADDISNVIDHVKRGGGPLP
ncbi:MAG: TlpA disulfide reductase family protein [Polyangiaceae bacterium]